MDSKLGFRMFLKSVFFFFIFEATDISPVKGRDISCVLEQQGETF